jgi:ferredoxin
MFEIKNKNEKGKYIVAAIMVVAVLVSVASSSVQIKNTFAVTDAKFTNAFAQASTDFTTAQKDSGRVLGEVTPAPTVSSKADEVLALYHNPFAVTSVPVPVGAGALSADVKSYVYPRGFWYPMPELGCNSRGACEQVCEQAAAVPLCAKLAEANGYMMVGTSSRFALFATLWNDSQTPNYCDGVTRCRQVCKSSSNEIPCNELATALQNKPQVLGASTGNEVAPLDFSTSELDYNRQLQNIAANGVQAANQGLRDVAQINEQQKSALSAPVANTSSTNPIDDAANAGTQLTACLDAVDRQFNVGTSDLSNNPAYQQAVNQCRQQHPVDLSRQNVLDGIVQGTGFLQSCVSTKQPDGTYKSMYQCLVEQSNQ